jgi:hypothetical protein
VKALELRIPGKVADEILLSLSPTRLYWETDLSNDMFIGDKGEPQSRLENPFGLFQSDVLILADGETTDF